MMNISGHAVVIGASGGIGREISNALARLYGPDRIHALSRRAGQIDLTDESSIRAAADQVRSKSGGDVRLVIVASGVLQEQGGVTPEKDWRALDAGILQRYMAVNAIGPALVAKHFLPLLPKEGRSVFAAISARVGSISDNQLGGWYGYRSSKAALNQFIRTFSVELARKRPEAICAALHPGTVETSLSEPFRGNVSPERLFSPERSAAYLLQVIDGLKQADSGGFFAWDGSRIEY
jgi:NAD(P)-dependent dehydrogenase (short-subunit alcohol dehydrogenase family)